MQLTANVYVETGFRGANVGFVATGAGVVMIDSPQKPTDAVAWRREVETKGPVKYLINTEPHRDHFTGNFFFSAPVIAHEKTREAIMATDLGQITGPIAGIDPEGLALIAGYRVNAPSITFSERLTLHAGNHTFHLVHLPGHTSGETAVFLPDERVVFTGDNVSYRVQPFLYSADPFAWLESLQKIGELEVDHVVPGHGEVCNKGYLAEQADFIQDWVQAVRDALGRGWSKEEAMARVSLLDRYPMAPGLQDMGPAVQQMNVSRLYDLLSGR